MYMHYGGIYVYYIMHMKMKFIFFSPLQNPTSFNGTGKKEIQTTVVDVWYLTDIASSLCLNGFASIDLKFVSPLR